MNNSDNIDDPNKPSLSDSNGNAEEEFIWPSDPRWVKEPDDEVDKHILNVLLHFRPPVDLSDGDGDYEEDSESEEDEG